MTWCRSAQETSWHNFRFDSLSFSPSCSPALLSPLSPCLSVSGWLAGGLSVTQEPSTHPHVDEAAFWLVQASRAASAETQLSMKRDGHLVGTCGASHEQRLQFFVVFSQCSAMAWPPFDELAESSLRSSRSRRPVADSLAKG